MCIRDSPYSFQNSHTLPELLEIGKILVESQEEVSVSGRLMALRGKGKAVFANIQAQHQRLQIYIRKDEVGEDSFDVFGMCDIGDFLGLQGTMMHTKTGELTLRVKTLQILTKAVRPMPVPKVQEKDGENIIHDEVRDKEFRYRQRYVDLTLNPEVAKVFRQRNLMMQTIRSYLNEQGFLEVETPTLQPVYGGANATPFTTHHKALDQTFYLRIANELYLKRLIIGGFDRVYEIAKDFRNEGIDRNHNPEFTMLEFYWAYADYKDCMILVEEIIRNVAKRIGNLKITWGKFEIDLSRKFKERTFYGLLKDATGSDLSLMNEKELFDICKENNIEIKENSNIGQMLDGLMSNLVEPNLIDPTFVVDYPKSISPLAKIKRDGSKNIVERFELFIGGSEFANSFTELNDPIDQRERLEAQAKLRERGDEEAQPVDDEFIRAMEVGMPPTGGVGIGIDRLVMLLTDNRWIRDVIFFPTMRLEKE